MKAARALDKALFAKLVAGDDPIPFYSLLPPTASASAGPH